MPGRTHQQCIVCQTHLPESMLAGHCTAGHPAPCPARARALGHCSPLTAWTCCAVAEGHTGLCKGPALPAPTAAAQKGRCPCMSSFPCLGAAAECCGGAGLVGLFIVMHAASCSPCMHKGLFQQPDRNMQCRLRPSQLEQPLRQRHSRTCSKPINLHAHPHECRPCCFCPPTCQPKLSSTQHRVGAAQRGL